ncbi:2,4-dienoyl-CoA reductase-like NADH-dependent reductase (Old Yellow Enzyme family) [Kribbella voronezhensis]|uniref:2,4-dienoyl-CoA reductase-like NADH-dependent reductase (Old Yellow Enzyme family) n=1 Tax=Kribbella voronezhensis TaxID=2512212 RepID=A0A4V3FIW1_9ACTN|nr:NADH:flavin oxidoreductase [Kribbella voronezhensis]TDU83973.1 2,4-dienoyl-CoA reductase-like NADH-dependent reductase (Old Yellow Enzyme family) [Kribbella voronezhensis]
MTDHLKHPALQPVRIGPHALPNRLVVAPMTRTSATPDGIPTAEMAQYYADFAAGGFGVILSEGTYTDTEYSQGYLNQPGLASEEHVAGWRDVTEQVHAAGGRIFAQLMHAGALSQGNPYRSDTTGPSAVQPLGEMMPDYGGSGPWPVPHELTKHDLDAVVEGFVAAALAAVRAGFDGVEVHAANGYLLDQFLTDYTNQRTDEYGGPVANRIRLTARVTAAIVDALPAGLPVGVRLSQTKVNDLVYRWPGGAADAEVVFPAVAGAGATYLHLASEGRDWLETSTLPDGRTITGLARRLTGLPVIANGGMHDPAQAAQVLADGHADLVSVARGALVNPDLPKRLAEGSQLRVFDRNMLHPDVTLATARAWQAVRS